MAVLRSPRLPYSLAWVCTLRYLTVRAGGGVLPLVAAATFGFWVLQAGRCGHTVLAGPDRTCQERDGAYVAHMSAARRTA